MPELDADFEISTNNLEAEYEITQSEHFDCSFEIFAAGTPWGEITGNIEDQTDLQNILTDLQSDIDDVADDLSIETDNRQAADTDLQDNIDTVDGKIDTHIADKTNPHEVTKTQVGLGNVDNTSDLNKPISTATQTALNGKQNTINDLSDIRANASNGQSAYNTIQNYGDIVTYNASSFATSTQGQKADTALQPNDNITELNNNAGYITSASLPTVNNNKITIQKNSTDVGSFTLNQSSDKTINLSVPTQASDINAVPTTRTINNKALSSDITLTASDVNALSSSTTINDLTTTAQQNALNSGATSTNIGQITTNANNISDINDLIPTQATTNNQLADKSFVNSSIATNTANFIGTFQSVAELEAYSGTLTNNDYAFVETTDTAGNTLFDRYKYTTATTPASWQYEYELNNSSFTANQWASINSGITSGDVTLIGTALQPNDNVSSLVNDAGYITSSSLPTVNNGTLTIKQNGTDVQTFTANQSSNATANIITPTKTSDLTNDSGFIDNSALSNYATQTDLTNGLATKQDTISDLSTIRSNASNGQSAYTTIGGYGDIVTYNASNFVQKNGDSSTQTISLTSGTGTTALGIKSMATSSYISLSGSSGWLGSYGVSSSKRAVFYNGTGYTLAYTSEIPTDTSDLTNGAGFITGITSSDVTTALGYTPYNSTNPAGYTSNIGTVTSVNNTQPDANGNVTISSGSSTDVQINGTSITSGGVANIVTNSAYDASSNKIATMSDLPASEIFVATYGTTTFNEVLTAYNAGKTILCKYNSANSFLYLVALGTNSQQSIVNFYFTDFIYTVETTAVCNITTGWSVATYNYPTCSPNVGNSTTPVYINNRVVTSTGLSIASSRFDGQWVQSFSTLMESSGTKSGVQISLSSYLPSDSYKYDVKFKMFGYDDDSSYGYFINTDIFGVPSTSSDASYVYSYVYGGTYSRQNCNIFDLPVGTGRYIKVYGTGADTIRIYALGYRRIGTNS